MSCQMEESTGDNEEWLRSLLDTPASTQLIDHLPNFGMQVNEALQTQLAIQKQLHEQPEQIDHSRNMSIPLSGQVLVNGTNPANGMPSKTRFRWTQDLQDQFVECVNCLGGPEKATPKAILRMMDSEKLTVYHVKSHLQKYRVINYWPGTAKGNSEKRKSIDTISQIENITGMQFKDALQMQLSVQRQLHEKLEIERNLQLTIEEQAKQLKMTFDQQNLEITSLHDDQLSTNLKS